jgi:UDP-GlcNAc3NAcA epimerase
MLEAIEGLLLDQRPDRVLVYGDTNSTMAAALAAVKLHVPVAHVEAGVRMHDLAIPEEVNRLVTDQVSDLLLCPTQAAVDNLRREGFAQARIRLVGDVMYDCALLFARAAAGRDTLERLGLRPGGYLLATVHRAEDTDRPERLRAIFGALCEIANTLPVVLPLHPRTRTALQREGLLAAMEAALCLTGPLGYLDMARLEQHARLVVTDSGGVQKEAFFHRVPCVVLMRESPWPELIELGWNRAVDPLAREPVAAAIREALQAGPGQEAQPYGDGHAAEAVVAALVKAA